MSYDLFIYFLLQFKAVLEFEPGLYTHHQVIDIMVITIEILQRLFDIFIDEGNSRRVPET